MLDENKIKIKSLCDRINQLAKVNNCINDKNE